jgi:hypothetical protein
MNEAAMPEYRGWRIAGTRMRTRKTIPPIQTEAERICNQIESR